MARFFRIGAYGFSAAPEAVSNAYLVYALSETGVAGMPEYQLARKQPQLGYVLGCASMAQMPLWTIIGGRLYDLKENVQQGGGQSRIRCFKNQQFHYP